MTGRTKNQPVGGQAPVVQRIRLRYAKRGTLDGVAFEGGGTKSLQFVRTERAWKIASLVWTDDRIIAP